MPLMACSPPTTDKKLLPTLGQQYSIEVSKLSTRRSLHVPQTWHFPRGPRTEIRSSEGAQASI